MIVSTWNMQGAQGYSDPVGQSKKRKAFEGTNVSDVLNLVAKGDVDVAAIQEAGGAPSGWPLDRRNVGGYALDVGLVSVGTSSRSKSVFVVWYDSYENGDASHNRCSIGILSRCYTNAAGTRRYGVKSAHAGLRPLVGHETASGVWVYSIHAPSGNHNAASGVAAALIGSIPAGRRWVCAGDYNCPPNFMTARGYNPIASTQKTHQNGNILDYAIVDANTACTLLGGTQVLVSDHYSQTFQVT